MYQAQEIFLLTSSFSDKETGSERIISPRSQPLHTANPYFALHLSTCLSENQGELRQENTTDDPKRQGLNESELSESSHLTACNPPKASFKESYTEARVLVFLIKTASFFCQLKHKFSKDTNHIWGTFVSGKQSGIQGCSNTLFTASYVLWCSVLWTEAWIP